MNKDKITGFGIGLLAGAIIGGTLALLYAPQPGEKTRTQIKDQSDKIANDIKGVAVKLAGDAKALVNKASVKDIKGF